MTEGTMKWARFTRPDDMPVWIALKQIVAVTVPIEGDAPIEACAEITTVNSRHWVKESVDAVWKQVMK